MPQTKRENKQGGGEQAFGRYRLLERLGEGGMAEVYKAKSFGVEGFEKVLVIKRILPKLAEHSKFVDMFVHEAKLAVRLSHANIVQVFDLGRVDHPGGEPTSYFIAMEYVPGIDLATLLSRCRRQKRELPFGMAVFVAAEVAKALDHAHRRRDEQGRPLGIVHRDISPQNILLSWEGEVKVTDFGIAKARDSIGEEDSEISQGKVRGKLAYMSPEQSRAETIDGRSDLFSLGIVLYEMLAGSNPFTAPTSFETLRRVQASEYPPLGLVRNDAPAPLVDLASKMLAKSAADRFADAGRLHEQLLGYFYSTGDRFGASNLAELLESIQDAAAPDPAARGTVKPAPPASPLEAGAVFEDEATGANDRTPVEVPSPAATPARTGSGLYSRSGEREKTGAGARTADLGERREVTALALSCGGRSRDGLEEVRTKRAHEVLDRYGARVLESEGGNIVALFGLGDADARDTDSAVRAGLVIMRACGGANADVSAGVHVARVVVDAKGAVVQDERLASLVSTAQSLARATDARLAVSAIAARIIRGEFSTDELAGAGRTAPEGGRVVVSARSPSAVYGRFVGRVDELKRLGDILAGATRRRAQVVTIQGDQGVGKTRLLAEMERRLSKGSYNVGFYIASCPKNGAGAKWSGARAMLQVLCDVQEGDDEERIRGVVPRLRALGLQSDETSAVLAELGATVHDSGAPVREDASTSLKSAFARMTQSLCDDRLHVFAWDDAQAMDPSTLDAILATLGRFHGRVSDSGTGAVSSAAGGLRAVFLFATRTEPHAKIQDAASEWDGNPRAPLFHRVALGELSDDDSAKLIGTRVGARILPADLLAFCRERAGGHPLFLEELIKELVESAAINVQSGLVKAKLDGATAVPRSLRTLIAGRVSRLDASDRGLMQAAAILGEPIPTQVLAALLKQTLAHVDKKIAELAARDLLRITGPEQAGFASPMHGEIVLDAIPPEARREIHAASADAYKTVYGDADVDHAERVAQHLYEAGDRDRAASAFARAAHENARLGRLESSIVLLVRAIDLAEVDKRSPAELVDWLVTLADAVSRCRYGPGVGDVAARVLPRIDAGGTLEQRVGARVQLARAVGSINLYDDANGALEEAFRLAGTREDLRKGALGVELETSARSGDFSRGRRVVEELNKLGSIDEVRLLLHAAHVAAGMGDQEAALRRIDEAERIAPAGDLEAATDREKARVLVYIYTRDPKKAVEASLRAVDLARSVGFRFVLAATLHNLGDACWRIGDMPRAYASLTESKEIAAAVGHERLVMLNRIHLAYVDGVGGVVEADALLRDFIRYAESRGYFTDALEGRFLLGSLLKHRGEKEAARREFEQVLSMATVRGNRLVAEDARETLAAL